MTAALELIRRDGADSLSMRQLAKQLGVTPMTIYYYVGNKDALFERCADAVLARVPRPTPTGRDWHNEVKTCAMHGFRLLLEYPGLCAEIVKRPPSQQNAALASYGVAILVAAGFDAVAAGKATLVIQTFVFGMIGLQAQLERAQRNAHKARNKRRPNDDILLTFNVPALVDFGLEAMLIGLRDKLGRSSRTKPRSAGTRVRSA